MLREQQAEVHSGLLSATTRFLLTVPRARSVAQGGSAARVEWDRMRAEFATVLDAAALSQVLGSSDASEAAEEVEDDARRLREALDDLNTAADPDTPPLIAAVASGIAELERSKADYLAAARRDLIVHDDPDAR